MESILWESAKCLAERVRRREVSSAELVETNLRHIERFDRELHAFVTVDGDAALDAARRADAAAAAGEVLGSLHGVPYTMKDLIDVAGIANTRGTSAYAGDVPSFDSPVAALARRAGAICVGKTATPEFGWSFTTTSPLTGTTVNPWDTARTAGGSSGGAGAALAAGMAPLAIATDGGGSVRQPAAFNGVVGLKPTAGLVPAYPPSRVGPLGHIGPMARRVQDVALLLDAICGADPRNRPSLDRTFASAAVGNITGWRVGYSATVNDHPVDAEVRDVVETFLQRFTHAGATVEPFNLLAPGLEDVWDVLYLSAIADMHRQAPHGAEYSDSFCAFLEEASAVPPGAAPDAEVRRGELVRHLARSLSPFDIIVTPTTSTAAFPAHLLAPELVGGGAVTGRNWVRLTQTWNLTGQPAISMPAGFTRGGLPVGVQLAAPLGCDGRLLRAASACEDESPPPLPPLMSEEE